jgi:hypothetical protein
MKKLLYGLLILIAILGTVYSCMNMIWGGMCGNQIIEEIPSPNKELKALIFTRDCGATSGYSTQLSIIENSDQLEDETGNTFILSDKVEDGLSFDNGGAKIEVIWTGDNSVTVYFDKRTEFTKQKEEIGDIKITYEQLVD